MRPATDVLDVRTGTAISSPEQDELGSEQGTPTTPRVMTSTAITEQNALAASAQERG